MVGASQLSVARRLDCQGHSIGSWCLDDPSLRKSDKHRATMVLFSNMSSFLGTIANPVLTILQRINFANKRTFEVFLEIPPFFSMHRWQLNRRIVGASSRGLQVPRSLGLTCIHVHPNPFLGVEDEMCEVRNSLDFAVGFSQIDPFPSRISRPSFESEPKVRTYSSACLAGFPGSWVGVDASIPSVSTVSSSWFRFLVSFHRSFLLWTMDGGMRLVSWKHLFVWVGFRSSVFGVWSVCTDGDPRAMVGTRQPSLPST